MIRDLFEDDVQDVQLAPGAMLLRGFARRFEAPHPGEVAPFPRRESGTRQRRKHCATFSWHT